MAQTGSVYLTVCVTIERYVVSIDWTTFNFGFVNIERMQTILTTDGIVKHFIPHI